MSRVTGPRAGARDECHNDSKPVESPEPITTPHRKSLWMSHAPHGISLSVCESGQGDDVCILLHGFGEGAYV